MGRLGCGLRGGGEGAMYVGNGEAVDGGLWVGCRGNVGLERMYVCRSLCLEAPLTLQYF